MSKKNSSTIDKVIEISNLSHKETVTIIVELKLKTFIKNINNKK
jgi:hypothetical protein